MSKEEVERSTATMKLRGDERANIRADLQEVQRIREILVAHGDDEGLRQRADATEKQAKERLDVLKRAIIDESKERGLDNAAINERLRTYDLTPPRLVSDEVSGALEALKADRVDEALDAFHAMNERDRYDFWNEAKTDDPRFTEAMMTRAEERAEKGE